MSRLDVQALWSRAQAQGLLPPQAQAPAEAPTRPWPVVVLTALGAWLVACLLLVFLALILKSALEGLGSLPVAALLLGAAVLVLRQAEGGVDSDAGGEVEAAKAGGGLFLQQLALAAMAAGMGLLAYGLSQGVHLPLFTLLLVLALFSAGLAWVLPQAWLRAVLGALAAGLVLAALWQGWFEFSMLGREFRREAWALGLNLGLYLLLALWFAAQRLLNRVWLGAGRARSAATLESFASGWGLGLLLGLALVSGSTFLLPANPGLAWAHELRGLGGGARSLHPVLAWMAPLLSALSSLAAAACLARAWPALRRQAWLLGVALALALLAWFNPLLGAGLLMLALCATAGRWRMAAAAGVSCAWMLGAFYYQLSWSLSSKALVLIIVAALLAAMAFWAQRRQRLEAAPVAGAAATPSRWSRPAAALLGLTVLLALLLANLGIWQKEQLIRHGRPIFLPLAPLDPRSLMQGDYMALNFRVMAAAAAPGSGLAGTASELPRDAAQLVLKLDARGLAIAQRPADGQALAPDEVLIPLVQKNGRRVLVTDAFFFKEGEAQRYAKARFGEFRVDGAGRALLVGLRGENLAPL
nr:GDYXXLXY domain-containing protein [uncultured Roseateles sp.]